MPPRRLSAAAAVLLVAACAAPARGLDGSSPEQWTAIATPISRAALLAALDVDPRLPRTLTLIEAVRRLHDDDMRRGTMRATVAAAITAAVAGPGASHRRAGRRSATASAVLAAVADDPDDDFVPLPLTEKFWRSCVLEPRRARGTVGTAILGDPSVGLMYIGLASTDRDTRSFLAGDCEHVGAIARTRAAAFSIVARSVRVRDGRIAVPGGEPARALWERLVGEPITRPWDFLLRLVSAEGGRLAYFYDAIAQLEPARQRFALGLGGRETNEIGVAVSRVCAEIIPSWSITERPFSRPTVDAGLLLQHVRLSPDGRLAGPATEAFLAAAFADGNLERGRDEASSLLAGPTADAATLLRQVLVPDWTRRRTRLLTLLFAQRVFHDLQPADAADALVTLRGIARLETLPFALERMHVRQPRALASAVRRAWQFGAPLGGVALVSPERQRAEISAFQGSVALLERLVYARTLDGASATALVQSLLDERTPDPLGYPAHVARWIERDLLTRVVVGAHREAGPVAVSQPTEGPDRAEAPEGAREHALLDALAGVGAIQSEIAMWEGARYRVDVPSAERARFKAIRTRQGGATLDDALDLISTARALREATTTGDLVPVRVSLARLAHSLPPVDPTELRTPAFAADAHGVVVAAARAIDGEDVVPATRVQHARRLGETGAVLLGDVLRSLVYACALGDAEGQAFLAGDVSRLHEFGLDEPDASRRRMRSWELPTDVAASGQPWHLSGSLLAVDLALSRFALRRSLGDMPTRQPTLSGPDRRALISTLAFMNPAELTEDSRAALLGALRRGREVLARALARDEPLDDALSAAGISGWRAQLVEWAHRFEPAAASALVARAELAWLGAAEPLSPQCDAWGAPAQTIEGTWMLRFPGPDSTDLLVGRQASAYLPARFVDLTLRVAEAMAGLGIPAALTRETLRIALQRFVDDVRLAHADDWLAMVRYVNGISSAEIENYVYGLTVPDGPLVPADAPAGRP